MENLTQNRERAVEVLMLPAGETGKLNTRYNQILLITEGIFNYGCEKRSVNRAKEGQIILLPVGKTYFYTVKKEIKALVIKITDPVKFCGSLSDDELTENKEEVEFKEKYKEKSGRGDVKLTMNKALKDFAGSLEAGLEAGLRFNGYFEVKTRELFILLRMYYDKEEVRMFFLPLYGYDASFVQYVMLNRMKYRSVAEFAKSRSMSPKQFNRRFISVMGKTPIRWMIENRAEHIKQEIITTNKGFTDIAYENRFSSDSEFYRFCKRELGSTPGELRRRFGEMAKML